MLCHERGLENNEDTRVGKGRRPEKQAPQCVGMGASLPAERDADRTQLLSALA